eukprot:CAMPEP_0184753810 /NCGR_PEP_ID=MMETSP0315-20130426/44295_1 /TAXON_ID=101924 /ORGANISM="Rhodosorus marinus, Strain UTEX LB 2760" /LENGTH=82 /DNA_ID=CAMNT_0027233199 /DNA_START=513 /DNA_END=761 /DNA_ORIENTATION=+
MDSALAGQGLDLCAASSRWSSSPYAEDGLSRVPKRMLGVSPFSNCPLQETVWINQFHLVREADFSQAWSEQPLQFRRLEAQA